MDASITDKNNLGAIERVRDPSGILWSVIFLILLLGITFYINCFLFWDFSTSQVIFALISNTLLLASVFRLKAVWNGIELDIENRRMSFQGGGIAANDFADYFKLDYLLQSFKRFDIDIDEIRQIEANDETTMHEMAKSVSYSTTYSISFVGSFGAATVWFNDGFKRDQIYSAIRQLNNMGTAIVIAK